MDNENEETNNLRELEDVKSTMKVAKLDVRNLTEVVQVLYYPAKENTDMTNIRLLELNDHMLKEIRKGNTMEFKGGLSEAAVLCTEEKTFEVKVAEISNSLLLVPELKFGAGSSKSPLRSPSTAGGNNSLDKSLEDEDDNDIEEMHNKRQLEHRFVRHIFHDYLECREIRPRYNKIQDLLRLTVYTGPEHEEFIDHKLLFTYSQLLNTVQCSRKQFEEGIRKYRAIEVGAHMRILSYDYEYRVLSLMLGLIRENSWQLDEVERLETITALEEIVPKNILTGVFDIYTTPTEGKSNKYTYNEEMVARLVAQNILQPTLKFRYEEFFSTWQEALPEGMMCDEKYLRYLGIVDKEGGVECVRSLLEENLPLNVQERMRILFKTKSRWTLPEIEPYLEYCTTPTLSVSMILAKHARSLTENNIRYFVSKY